MVTPFQTVGPFFDVLLRSRKVSDLTPKDLVIEGTLFDGAQQPVPDGLLEFWFVNPRQGGGEYRWCATTNEGRFRVGVAAAIADPTDSLGAPHALVSIFARGILTRYVTRMYFDGEIANDTDPVLALIPESRRHTLLARKSAASVYRFDVHLQGEHETVFLDV